MIELTLARTNELLDEIVSDFGADYAYPYTVCRYVQESPAGPAPSCLVGHVLHRAGVPLDALALNAPADVKVQILTAHGILRAEPDAVRLLTNAQRAQDKHTPWGDSVTAGRAYLEAYNSTPVPC